jgi:hypothetical protein
MCELFQGRPDRWISRQFGNCDDAALDSQLATAFMNGLPAPPAAVQLSRHELGAASPQFITCDLVLETWSRLRCDFGDKSD